ncbi:CDGSH iron-sulfur domain-containing protein [Candidatus Bathyarchaeota archaeon]|nr:CDGSH iron-sulfur domain-containing protein [Candidatus Bathyarchaeota archaeon]
MNKTCKIRVMKNGPYLMSGGVPLSKHIIIADPDGTANEWRESDKYPSRDSYVLCRCEQSGNKPFCDGTHLKIKFDGTETASHTPCLERAKEIEGPTLKLLDAEDLCASARFCHRAGGTWTLIPNSDNPEVKRIVMEQVRDCPSGRLMVKDKKTETILEPTYEPSIVVIEDPQMGVEGPLWVRGGIPIESAEGKLYEIRNRVTLCRCGKSSNKPFCDSSHYPEEHAHDDMSEK